MKKSSTKANGLREHPAVGMMMKPGPRIASSKANVSSPKRSMGKGPLSC